MEGQHEVGFLLSKASRLSKQKVNQTLAEVGLTFPQFLVVRHLYYDNISEGEIKSNSPAAVAEHLGYDRPTVTGIIERLVKQGFATRETNLSDRRSHTILLTEKSKELIYVIDNLIYEANDRMLSSFADEEIKNLKLYLVRIINNLND